MFTFVIKSSQKATLTLAPLTDTGVAVDVTPAPVFTVEAGPTTPVALSNATADGFATDVTAGTGPGDSVVLCTASVGGVPVSAEATITVQPDVITGALVISMSAPVPKAAAKKV